MLKLVAMQIWILFIFPEKERVALKLDKPVGVNHKGGMVT